MVVDHLWFASDGCANPLPIATGRAEYRKQAEQIYVKHEPLQIN
jgi:hypothetical protein